MSCLPDEVGQRLVEGPVVLRDLGSVIASWAVMIYIFAGSGRSGRGHLRCSLPEMGMKGCACTCHTVPVTEGPV